MHLLLLSLFFFLASPLQVNSSSSISAWSAEKDKGKEEDLRSPHVLAIESKHPFKISTAVFADILKRVFSFLK